MLVIDRKLNIVVPVERSNGSKFYVHAAPIGTETFEKYFLVLAKTFSAMAESGIVITSGPSVARLTLKQIAMGTQRADNLNWWDGDDGVGGRAGLIADIVRMSNVVDGDSIRPLADVFNAGDIDEDDRNDVLSLLVFFTVASRVPPRADRERLIRGMASIYHLASTSLSPTDYASSLKTPISADSTGEKVAPTS